MAVPVAVSAGSALRSVVMVVAGAVRGSGVGRSLLAYTVEGNSSNSGGTVGLVAHITYASYIS